MMAGGISRDLRAGLRRYRERIAALGGYGVEVRATMPDGAVRVGRLIERGWGGCQPGIVTPDGRRFAVDLDTVEVARRGLRTGDRRGMVAESLRRARVHRADAAFWRSCAIDAAERGNLYGATDLWRRGTAALRLARWRVEAARALRDGARWGVA